MKVLQPIGGRLFKKRTELRQDGRATEKKTGSGVSVPSVKVHNGHLSLKIRKLFIKFCQFNKEIHSIIVNESLMSNYSPTIHVMDLYV